MKKLECQCNKCKGACSYNPGWFMPGEAEKTAEYLNMTFQEFFNKYLGVNWWEEDVETEDIFVLAPAITNMKTGQEYPGDPRGKCIFFKKGLCEIHEVKPFECAQFIHDKSTEDRHWNIAKTWKKNQLHIKKLLGRNPEASEYCGFGLF